MSVDLPAPFSPTSACTSPGLTDMLTRSRASTPGNRLETSWTSRIALVGTAQRRLCVGRVVLAVLDDDVLGDRGAVVEVQRGLERERAEPRVRLDDGVDRAVDDGLHGVAGAVDRDDLDVLAGVLVGRLERGDRAERHLVVLRVDRGDVRVAGDELLHDRLALVAGELAGLLGDDLQARCLGLDLVDEAVGAVRSY